MFANWNKYKKKKKKTSWVRFHPFDKIWGYYAARVFRQNFNNNGEKFHSLISDNLTIFWGVHACIHKGHFQVSLGVV